jgi:hypothetical protein
MTEVILSRILDDTNVSIQSFKAFRIMKRGDNEELTPSRHKK